MRKLITDPKEIYEDLRFLAEQFPWLSKKVMVDSIEQIGKESWDECPKDRGELCMSFDITCDIEHAGLLVMSFGYNDPKAYFVHEIPPPMVGGREMGFNPFAPTSRVGRRQARQVMTLLGAMGVANDRMLSSVNIGCRTNWHQPPTKWKFLEDPVNRNIDLFPETLANEVDDLILRHKSPEYTEPKPIEKKYAGGEETGGMWGE